MTAFLLLDNEPMPYPWGVRGGISALRGRADSAEAADAASRLEAELWIGSHPRAPSRILDDGRWPDLLTWEQDADEPLPWLLKVLHAAAPLSLQVHPSAAQAELGFAAEEAAGVPRDADHRNYRDAKAKPEMILALQDGFEALCGFREAEDAQAHLTALQRRVAAEAPDAAVAATLATWRRMLTDRGPAAVVGWLLSGDPEIARLVEHLAAVARPGELVHRLQAAHPGDPGIAVALMLNHVRLAAGEALWLPAGVLHAYLEGLGAELMGPSDNVLRGGLTGKHVDVPELLSVLADDAGPPSRPQVARPAPGVQELRPAAGEDAPDLRLIEVRTPEPGEGPVRIPTAGPAAVVVLEGELTLTADDGAVRQVRRGDLLLHPEPGAVTVQGSGRLCAATGRGRRSG